MLNYAAIGYHHLSTPKPHTKINLNDREIDHFQIKVN